MNPVDSSIFDKNEKKANSILEKDDRYIDNYLIQSRKLISEQIEQLKLSLKTCEDMHTKLGKEYAEHLAKFDFEYVTKQQIEQKRMMAEKKRMLAEQKRLAAEEKRMAPGEKYIVPEKSRMKPRNDMDRFMDFM